MDSLQEKPHTTANPLDSPIAIRTANNLADVETLGELFATCFRNDEYWQWKYAPHVQAATGSAREAIIAEAGRQSRHTILEALLKPETHAFLAYDSSTNRPAAFAVWAAPTTANTKYLRRSLPFWKRALSTLLGWYDGLLGLLIKLHLQWLLLVPRISVAPFKRRQTWAKFTHKVEAKTISREHAKEGYWHLLLLGVHPAFARRGLAGRMLQWGIEQADKSNRPIYLGASPKGLPLYERFGFRVLHGDVCFPEDSQGGWTETQMVRNPTSKKE